MAGKAATSTSGSARRSSRFKRAVEHVKEFVAWSKELRLLRAAELFSRARGALLSAGLAFRSIFALFAALWVSFSIAGLVVRSNPDLQDALFTMLGTAVPNLIDTGNGKGAIDADVLLNARILGWTGAIALVGLIITALAWLADAREAIRAIFDLPKPKVNFLMLKLRDLAIGIGFGIVVIVSASLSVFSSQATGAVLGAIGFDEDSFISIAVAKLIALVLMFLLDATVLVVFYRFLSGIRIPPKTLIGGAVIGAIALGALKIAGTLLLGGASSNPLLASFAVIVGLLIWFNLICQVILLAASWIATGMPVVKDIKGQIGTPEPAK